jgi:hypothetical protein
MTPVIIPVPSGHWGLGPSLLYLFGVLGAVLYFAWREEHDDPTPEERRKATIERLKDEAFTRALMQAASQKRKGSE